jgi:hypothetical protein
MLEVSVDPSKGENVIIEIAENLFAFVLPF